MVECNCISQIIGMGKPRYIYHSISPVSGTARQEHAQVQELQATQAQRAITIASLQIIPKSCIYCALLALISNYLPLKIRNTTTRARTPTVAHTTSALTNARGGVRKCLLADVTQQSFVCVRTNTNHKISSFLIYLLRPNNITLFVNCQDTRNTSFILIYRSVLLETNVKNRENPFISGSLVFIVSLV